MIERERRPVCDFLELQNELAKEQMYPVPFSPRLFRSGSRDNNSEVMRVELFNQEWTNAYLRLVSKRVSDDVFRILAVRMVEPLAFECIQYSLNLFSAKGSIGRESEQEMKKVEELEEIKELLVRTHEEAQQAATFVSPQAIIGQLLVIHSSIPTGCLWLQTPQAYAAGVRRHPSATRRSEYYEHERN